MYTPRNKALLRAYKPLVSLNYKPLIRPAIKPLFLGDRLTGHGPRRVSILNLAGEFPNKSEDGVLWPVTQNGALETSEPWQQNPGQHFREIVVG